MLTLQSHASAVKSYFFHAFQYPILYVPERIRETSLESVRKYRDDVVWRLLCTEDRVDASDRLMYWEILDELMDISIQSAVRLLENLYEYTVRRLDLSEKRRQYPEVSNDVYRLEYIDEQGGYKDVCVGALLREAIDLLQEEANRLIGR